jgi:hypothetical protein
VVDGVEVTAAVAVVVVLEVDEGVAHAATDVNAIAASRGRIFTRVLGAEG